MSITKIIIVIIFIINNFIIIIQVIDTINLKFGYAKVIGLQINIQFPNLID